jgi:hypothetical protein
MFRTTYKMMGSEKESKNKGGRSGQKWTAEEDQQLQDEIKEGLSYPDIATSHGRTETAVKMRAIINAVASVKGDEIDVDELASSISLPADVIEEFLKNKQEWKDKKDERKEEKKNEKNEDNKKSKDDKNDNIKDDSRILIKFKMFLKKKGKFTPELDELFDEFMCSE